MSRQVNDTIDDYLKSLRGRVQELEAALREIAEHPRSRWKDIIAIQEIARKALDK